MAKIEESEKVSENLHNIPLHNIPSELPLLPLRNSVIFPRLVIPLAIGRPRSSKAVEEAILNHKMLCVVAQKSPEIEEPTLEDMFTVGTAVIIKKIAKMPDGSSQILVEGLCRVRVKKKLQADPYVIVMIEEIGESQQSSVELEALMRMVNSQLEQCTKLGKTIPTDVLITALNISDPGHLADLVASSFMSSVVDRQNILETFDTIERLREITVFLEKEIQLLKVQSKIQYHIQKEMGKSQREYYLREQMKAIQEELGEKDELSAEIAEFKEKIKDAEMSEEVEKKALKEVDRLAKMPSASAEAVVVRTYLDWLVTIPWSIETEDKLDTKEAAKILDEDHYGLEKPKERVIEYLAVRQLKKKMKGPILCFVGPPGVGKTSVGRSIARALGRKFIRMSLGGIHDEAEIRGHRRTYIGALPGRIIQGIRQAGSRNPVFMIDEIDKVGADFRGDPSAALLEVLDPEQNNSFRDHYLDVPFDLSAVVFITTANILDPIPPALRDRMEVLEFPGYIPEEKLAIAQQFLVPKQIEAHGLTKEQIQFTDSAIMMIISEYTREAGVRNVEREIATICRKVARKIVEGEGTREEVTPDMLREYLGVPKFFNEVLEGQDLVGVATGLAWTQAGGDILFFEATKLPGKGNLELTGHLGEIMQESAKAALSYARANARRLGIESNFYEKYDIHLHVPAGAIPKDGSSAGITIATVIISALTERPVRRDIGMTGEITLRGRILPIGGVREKVLAAHRMGIRKVIIPRRNEKDLEEVPAKEKGELEFIFVDSMDEVLNIVISSSPS